MRDFKWRFAVRMGKAYHPWSQARIVKIFDKFEEAEAWIKGNIKNGQHMYIDFVKEDRHDS